MLGRPDCQHLDNYRTCRILHGQGRIQRALGIRPRCVLDQEMPPQDGEWTCDEQKPFPRPVRFGGPYFSVLAQPCINSEAPTDFENSQIPPKEQESQTKMEQIMQFSVPSDIHGRELKTAGFIGLQRIKFNRMDWAAPDPLSALAVVEGFDLVIRREGKTIKIFREITKRI